MNRDVIDGRIPMIPKDIGYRTWVMGGHQTDRRTWRSGKVYATRYIRGIVVYGVMDRKSGAIVAR